MQHLSAGCTAIRGAQAGQLSRIQRVRLSDLRGENYCNASHSSVEIVHLRIVAIKRLSEITPVRERSTNMPSLSPSGAVKVYPLNIRKIVDAAIAVRLLPCSKGWLRPIPSKRLPARLTISSSPYPHRLIGRAIALDNRPGSRKK
jgi:hypothetical protein